MFTAARIETAQRLTHAAASVATTVVEHDLPDLADDGLLRLLSDATAARKALELIVAGAAAEIARRSSRELGYSGLAQSQGHRSATSLVQHITGQPRVDVSRALRAGAALADTETDATTGGNDDSAPPEEPTWLDALRSALLSGRLSTAQFQAVRDGLGEPPTDRYPELDPGFLPSAWSRAAQHLIDESSTLPVEDLRSAARIARDRLDPVGVALRFDERFAGRSFRTWIDEHGQHQGRISFDDEAAAWMHAILGAALRPRRGPRFVGVDGDDTAESDDRSNEQLQYDTLIAVLRTGANADPQQAFGDRQPGVRIVVDHSAITAIDNRGGMRVTGVGHFEDSGAALPAGVVEKYLCDAGAVTVTLDTFGRPLDVGREHRLFTTKQRIAIAVRDGGCIWPSCTAPPSQCEYHHSDHWWEHHGKTDVDDGVPLCRNCHLRLHNQGWRIARERDPDTGTDVYWLHPPPDTSTGEIGERTRLHSKSPRRFEAA